MRFKFVALFLLFVSLGLKWHGSRLLPTEDYGFAIAYSKADLIRQGYDVQIERLGLGKLLARRGDCIIVLRPLDPHATAQSFYRRKLSETGSIKYAWRGAWREDLPRIMPLIQYYGQRELARQSLSASRNPVWMAGIGQGCRDLPEAGFSNFGVRLDTGR